MARGYMDKILFVDLSSGEITTEIPDEKLYREFIGGYGVGARIVFDRQRAGRRSAGTGKHAWAS